MPTPDLAVTAAAVILGSAGGFAASAYVVLHRFSWLRELLDHAEQDRERAAALLSEMEPVDYFGSR